MKRSQTLVKVHPSLNHPECPVSRQSFREGNEWHDTFVATFACMFQRVFISFVLKPSGCYFDPGVQDGGEASETSSVMGTSSGDAGCSECDQSVKGSAPSSPPTVIHLLATLLFSEVLHAVRLLLAARCAHGVTKYVVVEVLLTRSVTVKGSYGYNYIQLHSVIATPSVRSIDPDGNCEMLCEKKSYRFDSRLRCWVGYWSSLALRKITRRNPARR